MDGRSQTQPLCMHATQWEERLGKELKICSHYKGEKKTIVNNQCNNKVKIIGQENLDYYQREGVQGIIRREYLEKTR